MRTWKPSDGKGDDTWKKHVIWIHRGFASATPQNESFCHLGPCYSGSIVASIIDVFFPWLFPGFSFRTGWFVAEVIYPFRITKRLAVKPAREGASSVKGNTCTRCCHWSWSPTKTRIVRMVGSTCNSRKETWIHFVLTCLLQMMVENCLDPWAYGRMLNPDWPDQTFSQKLVRSAQGGILSPNDQDPAHPLVIGGYKL